MNDPVESIQSLRPGDRVSIRDAPWRIRRIQPLADGAGLVEVESAAGNGETLSIVVPPERIVPLPSADLQFDLKGLETFSAWSLGHRILSATAIRETGILSGARFGRVDIEAYQMVPALRVLRKPRPSLLIADDVGLGKTIEAGLILLELMARGRAGRTLVIVPPGLLTQWREELKSKFGLSFVMIENAAGLARVQGELPAGVSPWDALPRVLTSIDFLKRKPFDPGRYGSVGT